MIDISAKEDVPRRAVASGELVLQPSTLSAVRRGEIEKGDVLASARVAALHAAKKTWEALPHCHPIPITAADASFDIRGDRIVATVEVSATYKTGVEMEALYACATALLTVWDMVKRHEKDDAGQYPVARIQNLHVLAKEKGR